jgi:hypothetical protein
MKFFKRREPEPDEPMFVLVAISGERKDKPRDDEPRYDPIDFCKELEARYPYVAAAMVVVTDDPDGRVAEFGVHTTQQAYERLITFRPERSTAS